MKALTILTLVGAALLASACAVQPYRADINTFEGLIKVNPKDVRECEAYAKVKAEPEETLEMDLAYGVLWCIGQHRPNCSFVGRRYHGVQLCHSQHRKQTCFPK